MGQDVRTAWDVAVVGGGIVGLSSALELQARGRRVLVIDPDRPRDRASFGNAGAISRGSVLAVASPSVWRNALRFAANADPAVRIRWGALPDFARWLATFLPACNEAAWRRTAQALSPLTALAFEHHQQLARRAGCEHRLRRTGYLKLYRSAAGFAASALERQILAEAGVRAEPLDEDELRQLEPSLRGLRHALFFPESGSADDPGEVVEAYRQAFVGAGGGWLAGHVQALEPSGEAVTLRLEGGEAIQAAAAVVAAGVGAGRLLRPFGYRLPLAAERGYHRHFALRDGASLGRPVHDVEGAFAAAPIDGGVRLLTGIELARPDDPPDEAQLRAAEAGAPAVLPLGAAAPGPAWVGSRPSIADGLPVIGRARRHPRLILAFGHGHIGFSTGPLTGRIVADLEAGTPSVVPLAPFAVERFG